MLKKLWIMLTLLFAISSATPNCEVVIQKQNPSLGVMTVANIGDDKNVCLTQKGFNDFQDSSESALKTTQSALELCDKSREEWKSLVNTSADSLSAACSLGLSTKDSIIANQDSAIVHLTLQSENLDSALVVKDAIIANREEVIKACEESQLSLVEMIQYAAGFFALGFLMGSTLF